MSDLILDEATADGDSDRFYHAAQRSGILHVYIEGDLGGGTLTLKAISPSGATVDVEDGAFTTPGLKILQANSFIGYFNLADSSGANVSIRVESEHDAFRRVRDAN